VAEELAHTTFVRAWDRRRSLPDPLRVRAWLYRLAHGLGLSQLPRRAPVRADRGGADVPELLWAAAASLDPKQYAVLDLSARQALTPRDVADVLGVSTARASVRISRAREALGGAVRRLLVTRQCDRCNLLARLVPAGAVELTAEQRRAVEQHMRQCERCRPVAPLLTASARLLGSLPPTQVPPALVAGPERLLALLRSLPAQVTEPPAVRRSRAPWRWWPGAVLIVTVALVLLAAGRDRQPRSPTRAVTPVTITVSPMVFAPTAAPSAPVPSPSPAASPVP
jgi:hypothetical protein